MLAANACQTPSEQWALGLLLASAQVGQAADTLMPIVGTARARELLLQWAKTFEAELPLLEEWTEELDEESFMPARLALKQDVIEAVGDACEEKAMDLVQQGYIRMPSWTASDFGALASPEEDDELRGRLAAWFLSGLTQKLAHCYDCCGVLMRMQEREQTQSLAATVEATLSACLQLRGMVLEASDLAEQPAKLHLALPVVNRTEAPGDALGEEFVSVIATALDSAFRRVEAQIPSLLLRHRAPIRGRKWRWPRRPRNPVQSDRWERPKRLQREATGRIGMRGHAQCLHRWAGPLDSMPGHLRPLQARASQPACAESGGLVSLADNDLPSLNCLVGLVSTKKKLAMGTDRKSVV